MRKGRFPLLIQYWRLFLLHRHHHCCLCRRKSLHSHAWGDFRFIMNFHSPNILPWKLLKDKYAINDLVKGKVCMRAKWSISAGAYPGFCSLQVIRNIYTPSWMRSVVHRRVTLSIKFASTHLYTWAERGHRVSKVSCPRTQHNVPSRAQTRTARSGVELANHEATAPPTILSR